MKTACYTDIHNQQAMLNYPTVLRKSAVIAAENTVAEFGKTDLYVIGGDTISDYPYWNKSCALAFKNWLDIKKKITENFEKTAKGSKVLYVNGNNDLMLGDLPTADNPPYNTCEFYHSGSRIDTLGELSEGEYYGIYAKSKGKQAGLYHLAFHYIVCGIDFFGLNIDHNTAFNSDEGLEGALPGETENKFYEATGTPEIGQYLVIEANEVYVEFNCRNMCSLQGYSVNNKREKYIY